MYAWFIRTRPWDGVTRKSGRPIRKKQGQIVAPGADGSYAAGRTHDGFAIETRLGGDKIVPMPVLATLRDKELTLSYGVCSFPRSHWLVNGSHGMSIVQWLIHGVHWANYKVTFRANDLGKCPALMAQ